MATKPVFLALGLTASALSAAAESDVNVEDGTLVAVVIENDLFQDSDRHYTNGLRLGFSPPSAATPDWLKDTAQATGLFPEGGQYRASFTLGQNMFTPRDITAATPDPDDRPYAGWLYATAAVSAENERRLNSLELSIGLIGPSSLAGDAQEWYHDLIGADDPKGWDSELEDELALMVTYQRRWNAWERDFAGLDVAFSPHFGGALGNVYTYANIGATVRVGQNSDGAFGPPRIQPSVPGSGLMASDGFNWYLFASLEGRAVAQNIFLDGNTFRDSPSVDKEPYVGDLQFGFVIGRGDLQFGYTHVFRTDEFETQRDNSGFGAFSVSKRF